MGKVNGTYPSLLGGVSQAPFTRRPMSKHIEQVNMMPHPVLGLTRRPPSVQRDIESISATTTLNAAEWLDAQGFVGYDFQTAATEYTLFVRSGALAAGSTLATVAVCVDRTNKAIIPVSVKGGDTVAGTLRTHGASSGCAVGSMVVLSGNNITPTITATYPWAIEENQKRAVIWVRGGAYKRRYRFAIIRGNQKLWVEYTTKDPAYPLKLDTSDLNPEATDYLKRVNDRTNEYNNATTAWINAALLDITPESIANNLAQTLNESGFLPDAVVSVVGSAICITDPSIEDVEGDDGGDGPLLRAVGNTAGAPELLTALGYPGKVVQVRPGNSKDGQVFYLKARAKDGSSGAFTKVTWEECAGVEYTPSNAFVFATVAGGTCYVSSDVGWINTQAGTTFPNYIASAAGDSDSNPPPEFFGKAVSNVAVFQDRLVVSKANGYVATSRPGDYLNFFRQSVLTGVDDDPVSFAIIGGESDTVRHSLMYDRNLVLVGDKKQYLINGKAKLAHGSASATVMAAIPGTAVCPPALVEDRLFYAKANNGYGSLHWFQPGRIAESPETFEATSDLDTYISGAPLELTSVLTPDILFARTASALNQPASVFLYDYGTTGQGQRAAAPHRWEFSSSLGPILGLCQLDGSLFAVRVCVHSGAIRAVLDELDLQVGANDRPYLDSQANPITATPPLKATGAAGGYAGGAYSALGPGEYGGWPIDSYVVLTSPSIQAQSGQPMAAGELVVSALDIEMADTGGVVVQVNSSGASWGGYLRGKAAYSTPAYPEVAECSVPQEGFPGCGGGEPATDPASFTHFITVDKSGARGWTVYPIEPIDESYDRYRLTHNEIPHVYGHQYNLGAADIVDFGGSGPMRPMAEGHSRSVTGVFYGAQVNIPVQAGGSVTVAELGEAVQFTTSSGEVYIWTQSYGAGEFTYTLTRQESAPACPLPCDAADTIIGGTLYADTSVERRRMSLTDAGTPTPPTPGAAVTDAAPYEEVKLHLPIGRPNRAYNVLLAAYYWAPLTITSIDWTGLYHNRTRRV